jgi:hypothetical protein
LEGGFDELPFAHCLRAITEALNLKLQDNRPRVGGKDWSNKDKFIVAAFYLLMGKEASMYCSRQGANYLSPLLSFPRSFDSINYIRRTHKGKSNPKERALETFETWRGGWTSNTGDDSGAIPHDECKGHSFTLSGDGSVQRRANPFSGHSGVTVVRDTDRKVMMCWVFQNEIGEDNALLPETEAATFAAAITKNLLQQGAMSVQYIGDSRLLRDEMEKKNTTPQSAKIAPIRELVPDWRDWYVTRRREQNRLADFLTHIYPAGWGKWFETEARPDKKELEEFVNELYQHRMEPRLQPIRCPLPSPGKGEVMDDAIRFVEQIPDSDFEVRNIPLNGLPGRLTLPNVLSCMAEALRLSTEVPRLPILISRWLTGNIKTSRRWGKEKEMRTRCELYMRRQWETLHVRSKARTRGARAPHERGSDRHIAEVLRDVENGKVGKARQRLQSNGVFDMADEDICDNIRQKYPQDEVFSCDPSQVTDWTPAEQVMGTGDDAVTINSLAYSLDYKLPDHKGAGNSTWTYELMKAFGAFPEYRQLLCSYAEKLVNGNLPDDIMTLFKMKYVVPLVKKVGSRDARPIGVGECIRRWAAIAIGIEVTGHAGKWPASESMARLKGQFGVGVRAGAESMYRVAQSYLFKHQDRVGLKLDAKNGYNALKRSAIWDGLKDFEEAGLSKYFFSFYTGEAKVVDGCGLVVIIQVMGVDQGDPLGPLLFAIGMWKLCEEVMRDFPDVTFMFYIDDTVLLGNIQDVLESFHATREALARGNLILATQPGKQEVWGASDAKQAGFPELCRAVGSLEDLKGMEILGIPLGNPDYVRESVGRKASEYIAELKELGPLAGSHPKHAMSIWLQCSIASFNYIMRAISPEVIETVEQRVVGEEQKLFLQVMGRPCLDEDDIEDRRRWQLASMPQARGGVGIRNLTNTAYAAHLASWADCLGAIDSLDDEWARLVAETWTTARGRETDAYKGLEVAHKGLGSTLVTIQGIDLGSAGKTVKNLAGYTDLQEVQPVQVGEAKESVKGRRQLQKKMTNARVSGLRQFLLSPVTPESRGSQVTIRSNTGGVTANAWLHTFDHNAQRGRRNTGGNAVFSPEEFRVALQIRLHLTDPWLNAVCERFGKVMCVCGRELGPADWPHFLSCPWGGFSEKHDGLVKILVRFARGSGFSTRGDKQSPPIGAKGKQADFELSCNGLTEAFDVRVISALSEVYNGNSLKRLYPISFGDNGAHCYNFNPAREDGAAMHVSRLAKIKEYIGPFSISEAGYQWMDSNKPELPEERRQLKNVEIFDPVRQQKILFTPLLFQIGGSMAPDTAAFVRDIAQAAADYNPLDSKMYGRTLSQLSVGISNSLMRNSARQLIRCRNQLCFGKPTRPSSVPLLPDTLSGVAKGWMPPNTPFYPTSDTFLGKARRHPPKAPFEPIKVGPMKVHYKREVGGGSSDPAPTPSSVTPPQVNPLGTTSQDPGNPLTQPVNSPSSRPPLSPSQPEANVSLLLT